MSYCWRLQYYCKLGATHGAGPIYYVSRLPQQAHKFRDQLRVLALPRLSTGDTLQGLATTSHLVTHVVDRREVPPRKSQ
uniref:Uncharacterized protein n=1 Tax=Rhinolophus ferrumequinum TaxID=59479 RepID=A0A671EJF7_RHIFE